MNWGLFCQIEVILLTIGLVISFIIAMRQNAKDNSFAKRMIALGKVFGEYSKGIIEIQSKIKTDMLKKKEEQK